MKRKVMYAVALAMVALSAIGMSGCDFIGDLIGAGLYSVSGTTVNVSQPVASTTYWKGSTDTSLSLEGATITLTNVYDATKSTTAKVDSVGAWTALNVEPGKYRITGAATGWTFIPKEIEITGILQSAEPILAFETPADLSEIMIVVEWDRPTNASAIDVDGILVLDQGRDGVGESAVFSKDFNYNTGTFTDLGETLPYDVPARYVGTAVTQDRDVYGAANLASTATTPLVETIRIKTNPFSTGSSQMRYFINAWNSETLTGDSFGTPAIPSTYATVTVMQASATTTNGLLGIFNIALDSFEKTLGVVKIDVETTSTGTNYWIKSYGNEGVGVAKSIE